MLDSWLDVTCNPPRVQSAEQSLTPALPNDTNHHQTPRFAVALLFNLSLPFLASCSTYKVTAAAVCRQHKKKQGKCPLALSLRRKAAFL